MQVTPVEGIKPLWDTMPLMDREETTPTGGVPLFADIFQSAVDNVKQTSAEHAGLEYQLAVGEIDNPALVSIAASKASMSVELLIQLRNKALDAYSELMRISI